MVVLLQTAATTIRTKINILYTKEAEAEGGGMPPPQKNIEGAALYTAPPPSTALIFSPPKKSERDFLPSYFLSKWLTVGLYQRDPQN